MKTIHVLILEDEKPASRRLIQMINKSEPSWKIHSILDSIKESIDFLNNKQNEIDLIFMDIQLADGHSFEIFKHVNIGTPVIFATAYSEYAIKAFKVSGMDYLLKPFDQEELQSAINKFTKHTQNDVYNYQQLIDSIHSQNLVYKERFLVKKAKQLVFVETKNISHFISDDGYVEIHSTSGEKYLTDSSLEKIINQINPNVFFKISRKFIVNINSIKNIETWFNSRLKLNLKLETREIIVSRDRVKTFKQWLDQ